MTDAQTRKFFDDMSVPERQRAYNEFVDREKAKLAELEEAEAVKRENMDEKDWED